MTDNRTDDRRSTTDDRGRSSVDDRRRGRRSVVGGRSSVVPRGSWLVGRGSWVVGRGRRCRWSSMVDEVVGRRWAVVGRRLSMRSVGCRSSVVGRGSWVVGRLGRRGSSWVVVVVVVGCGSWSVVVLSRGLWAWVPWVVVVGRGRGGESCVGRGSRACRLVLSLVPLQSSIPSLVPSQALLHPTAWRPTLALAPLTSSRALCSASSCPAAPWTPRAAGSRERVNPRAILKAALPKQHPVALPPSVAARSQRRDGGRRRSFAECPP